MVRIAIISCNEIEEMELVVPLDIWRRAGFRVDVISLEKKNTIVLQNGLKVSSDTTIDKANINQYNAIYLPGGKGHRKYFVDAWPAKNNDNVLKLQKFLMKFAETKGKYIFAMCAAPKILNELGLLSKNKYTCYPGFEKGNEKNYTKANICVDNEFITGRAPGAVLEFSYAVIEELDGKDKVEKVRNEIFDLYEPMKK